MYYFKVMSVSQKRSIRIKSKRLLNISPDVTILQKGNQLLQVSMFHTCSWTRDSLQGIIPHRTGQPELVRCYSVTVCSLIQENFNIADGSFLTWKSIKTNYLARRTESQNVNNESQLKDINSISNTVIINDELLRLFCVF